jgi:ribonuclease HII
MLVVGVDENGLGPRLGPLVATSVVLETPEYRRAALCGRGLDLGLTDSKETGGFGRMSFIESVALALLGRAEHPRRMEASAQRGLPCSADDLLDRLSPESRVELRACCPDDQTAAQCWAVDLPLPAFGGDPALGATLLRKLVGRSKLRVVDVQSRLACAGMLNAKHAAGHNKLTVDLELFQELIRTVRQLHGGSLLVICGMVGGIRDYSSRLHRLHRDRVGTLRGRRGQRRYAVDGLGEIRFEVNADARHLPVALASIVGKYLREICMLRIGEFYRRDVPGLQLASGYHDPITSRFIEETQPSRHHLGIVSDCFQRHG